MPRNPEQGSHPEQQVRPRIKQLKPDAPAEWQEFNEWRSGLSLKDSMMIRREGKFPEGTPDMFAGLYSNTTTEERILFGIFGYPTVEEILARTPEDVERMHADRNKEIGQQSHQVLKEQVDAVLATLSERERKVLILRFGLEDGKSRTLKEAGEAIGRSARTAGRVETSGLKKLRRSSPEKKKLRDSLA